MIALGSAKPLGISSFEVSLLPQSLQLVRRLAMPLAPPAPHERRARAMGGKRSGASRFVGECSQETQSVGVYAEVAFVDAMALSRPCAGRHRGKR